MPLEIKDKRTKEVKACGIMGNTLKCGHCDFPIQDDITWIALDDPYFCMIHETCLSLFQFDGTTRSRQGQGRVKAKKDLDDMQRELHQMVARPWWQNSKTTKRYHKALQDMLLLHQSLRTSRVIEDADEVPPVSRGAILAAMQQQSTSPFKESEK